MKDRRAVIAREFEQIVVALRLFSWPVLALYVRPQRARRSEFSRQPNAGDGKTAVELGRKIVRLHRGRRERIGRTDAHRAARLGPQLAYRHREPRPGMRLVAGELRRAR